MFFARTHRAVWLMITLGACTPMALYAQAAAPPSPDRFEHIDSRDGLSHNTVFSIHQDRLGFLWIGTDDGLNRYDGYTFTIYRHDPDDPTSLLHNTVRGVNEDPWGHVWIRTPDGFSRFDRRTEQFMHYVTASDDGAPQTPRLPLPDGPHGWLLNEDGFFRYDPEADTLQRMAPPPDTTMQGTPQQPLPDRDTFWSFYVDQRETVWIGTVQGYLHKYVPSTGEWEQFKAPWQELVIEFEDGQGRLWISNSEGAGTFDPATEVFARFKPPAASSSPHYIHLKDRNGFLWFFSASGPLRYDPVTQETHSFTLEPQPLGGLAWNIYEDRAGSIWLATLSGLYRLDPASKPFRHHAHDPRTPHSLSNNIVMAAWASNNGDLWVGTLGGGLNRFNPTTGHSIHHRHQPDRPGSLCHDHIWSLYEDARGTLWIGTDEGLCARDPQTGRFRRHLLPLSATWPTSDQPPVNAIREDARGRLWLATNDGLHRLDPATGLLKHVPVGFKNQRPHGAFIQSLHLDRADLLWLGASDSRLFRLAPDTEALTAYPGLQAVMPVANEGLLTIQEDHRGILWLGSKRGLTRFDPKTDTAQHYGPEQGLPASNVYAILEDERHQLWISTNSGLAYFTDRYPEPLAFRTYDTGDGLGNAEFNRRAAFKNNWGEFFFGGMNGLTSFFPDQIHDNPYRPPVVLTQIQTSNRDTTVSVVPYGLDPLVLSYRDYTVAFEFAALNFTNPAQNQYAYQLEGFDEGWIESGTRRQVQYTNIPPGRYTFRVKAANNDGVWNEDGVALRLTVTPPFWQTWWFRGLALMMMVALLTAAYRYRVAQLLAMERIRMRIARDLHDDIGSGLSSIALASELISQDTGLHDDRRRRLAQITGKARLMATALTDIVWLVDPEHDQLDDLIEHLEEVTRTLLVGIDYRIDRSAAPMLHRIHPEFRRHVYLIYKEILHNIVKHAQATHVTVTMQRDGRQFVLRVADDGVGFDPEQASRGHGLKNMQTRAHQIGGTLTLTGRPGEGTSVRLDARIP